MKDEKAQQLIEEAVYKAFKKIKIVLTYQKESTPEKKKVVKTAKASKAKKSKPRPSGKIKGTRFTAEGVLKQLNSYPMNAHQIAGKMKLKATRQNKSRIEGHLYNLHAANKCRKVPGSSWFYVPKNGQSTKN